MRILAAILTVLLLAACQQPAAKNPAASDDASSASSDLNSFGRIDRSRTHYFRTENEAMMKELAGVLLAACYDKIQAHDKIGFHACLRDQMAEAFDDSGKGRAGCRHFDGLDDFADCIVVGNMVLDLRHRLEDNSPVPADFWTNRETMVQAMTKSAVIGAAANCAASSETKTTIEACAEKWFIDRLEVPDDLMKQCETDSSGDDRNVCLADAETLQFMRTHMARLAGNSI